MFTLIPYPMDHGFDKHELLKVAESMKPVEAAKE